LKCNACEPKKSGKFFTKQTDIDKKEESTTLKLPLLALYGVYPMIKILLTALKTTQNFFNPVRPDVKS
jgi:hypothetical protein